MLTDASRTWITLYHIIIVLLKFGDGVSCMDKNPKQLVPHELDKTQGQAYDTPPCM
jgi:hypothetical protein